MRNLKARLKIKVLYHIYLYKKYMDDQILSFIREICDFFREL
jgi:hypothetical protein